MLCWLGVRAALWVVWVLRVCAVRPLRFLTGCGAGVRLGGDRMSPRVGLWSVCDGSLLVDGARWYGVWVGGLLVVVGWGGRGWVLCWLGVRAALWVVWVSRVCAVRPLRFLTGCGAGVWVGGGRMSPRVGLWSVCDGWLLVDGARWYGVWVGGLLVVVGWGGRGWVLCWLGVRAALWVVWVLRVCAVRPLRFLTGCGAGVRVGGGRMSPRVGLWSVCDGWLLVDGARWYGVWVGGLLVVVGWGGRGWVLCWLGVRAALWVVWVLRVCAVRPLRFLTGCGAGVRVGGGRMSPRVGLWSVCDGWLLVDGARWYGVWVGGLLVVVGRSY